MHTDLYTVGVGLQTALPSNRRAATIGEACSHAIEPQSLSLTSSCNNALQVHTPEYLHQFLSGTLPDSAARQIGFGKITAEAILTERTQAEVAGSVLC